MEKLQMAENILGKSLSVNERQIGGNHYQKLDPAPWDVVIAWNLGYLEGTALKYIARWRDKGGVNDIKKAIHFLEKLVEITPSGSSAPPGYNKNTHV